jgi:hypothetical protein
MKQQRRHYFYPTCKYKRVLYELAQGAALVCITRAETFNRVWRINEQRIMFRMALSLIEKDFVTTQDDLLEDIVTYQVTEKGKQAAAKYVAYPTMTTIQNGDTQ